MLDEVFKQEYIGDKDTETHHVCGTCGQLKPLSEFYKDGTTKDGKVKYRRDCKECYKRSRMMEAKLKQKKGR